MSLLVKLGRWLLMAAALLGVFWLCIEIFAYAHPPDAPKERVGGGFTINRQGQHVLHLSGNPYDLGFHNARLLAPYMAEQESTLLDLLLHFSRSPATAMFVRQLSLLYLIGLDTYLTPSERLEIRGLAEGSADPFPDLGPRYARLAAYHAIHELSQRFAFDNPLFACSLIVADGTHTRDGHTYLARNFDFEGGEVFDQHKTVLAIRPTHGYGFVHVAWSGMAGVVSGINEKGLVITINAGASADYRRVGVPTTLLVRRALEQASTVDEAIKVLTGAPPFVTDIMGLADRAGDIAVLELTPKKFAVRRNSLLLATNHFESPELQNDVVNIERQSQTTTLPRRARLERLFAEKNTNLDARDFLATLRDTNDAQGNSLPPGHRHALDAMIATHSVIFDATAGKIWVSRGPHTLGPYLGYDVAKLLAADSAEKLADGFEAELAADPRLTTFPRILEERRNLAVAQQLIQDNDTEGAEQVLNQISLLAEHPAALRLAAQVHLAHRKTALAAETLARAIAAPPEYAAELKELHKTQASIQSVTAATP